MFKWIKFGLAGVVGLFVLVGIIMGIATTIIFNLYVEKQKQMNATASSDAPEETEQIVSEDEPPDVKNDYYVQKGILNKENYDQLQPGMSYKEATEILGAKGRWESERKNLDIHSITYQFAEKGYRGIDISLSFLNGELSHKTYYFYGGSPEKSATIITADEFDEVKPGMSYEEVKNIIGGDGLLIADSGFPDGHYHSRTYKYDGEAADSEAEFKFNDDMIDSKSQRHLD